MKKNMIAKFIGASLIALSLSSNAMAEDKIDFSKLDSSQQAQLGSFIENYLVNNPEVLIKMSNKLQAQQQQKQEQERKETAKLVSSELKDELVNDSNTPAIGNKDADVVLIEFFDYNCVYCSKAAPTVENLVKANPDVKFVFKEWPIFDKQMPTSDFAAKTGFKVFKEKGSDAYYKYHNAVYATKHVEGQLTKEDVIGAAKTVGVDAATLKDNDYQDLIDKNKLLASKMKIGGTPSFVIMSAKNPTPDNTFVYPGILSQDDLQSVINQVKGAAK